MVQKRAKLSQRTLTDTIWEDRGIYDISIKWRFSKQNTNNFNDIKEILTQLFQGEF